MVKVIATLASQVYNKKLKEFHRIVKPGEVFEVTEDRYKYLHGENPYKIVFVNLCAEPEAEQKPVKPKTEKKTKVKAKPEATTEPEIYVIEPNKEPVQVNEDLEPKV